MRCGKCNAEINWVKIDCKWFCHNANTTTDHWDLCSQLRTSKIKKEGEYFENKNDRGYLTEHKASGVFYVERKAKPIIGKNYVYSEHAENCVPWESCICNQ